ncbi:MAG: TonB-dependent receptor [Gemmatimonadetes bacterium]|nr:TonB-dependent receptor [Gemmatimonadota bacterium]
MHATAQQGGTSGGGVRGWVADEATGRPLGGVAVSALRGGETLGSVVTDAEGRFRLQVGGSTVRLRAERLGYRGETTEVRLRAGGSTEVQLRLAATAIELEPVEIIGAAGAHRLMEGTATRITPQMVRQVAPIGTQELLQHVPGVTGFADDGIGNSRISIGIRGLNPRRSSHVLFLEDGIPIQSALYLYPNMYYNAPPERIDRVEVIKGSSAIRYGPHTMGGVINYITSRPRTEFGGFSQLVAGTNGYLSLFTELGGWGSAEVKPEVQLLYKRGEGFRENNDFQQYNGTFKINFLPDPSRVIYVKANANFEDSNATYTGLTEYSFLTNPRFNPKEHDNFRVFRSSLDVLYNRQLSPALSGDTRVYVNFFDRRWWRENDVFVRASQWNGAEADPVPPFQPGDLVRVGGGVDSHGNLRTFYVAGVEQSYGVEHPLLGLRARLNVGARAHWERFVDDKQQGSDPDSRRGVYFTGDPADLASVEIVGQSHHYETRALSLFASERLEAGRLTVTPGLRFEVFEQQRIDRLQGSRYEDKTSWVVLPGVGANYGLGDYHLFGGVHRGYTPPSSGTLRVVNFGADADAGGLDLRSETSWNYEAGLRGDLEWLGFEAAAFRVEIQDLVAAGRGTAFHNLGRANTAGVELAATARGAAVSSWLPNLNVAYTYLDTEVEEGIIRSAVVPGGAEVSIAGLDLPYAPHHTLVAGLSADRSDGAFFRTDVRYVSDAFTDFENIRQTYNRGDTGPIPAYAVVDASAGYRVRGGITATVGAKNLLDEVYIGSRLHSNPGQPQANLSSGILPGARRQITLGVRYDF